MQAAPFSLTELVTMGLATYYLTYVVTQSDFPLAERFRMAVIKRWGSSSWQGYLAFCGWCVSAYTSAIVVGATAIGPGVPIPVLVWLAVAAISGVLILLVNGLAQTKNLLLGRSLADRIPPNPVDRVQEAVDQELKRGRT